MSVQTSYTTAPVAAYAGMLADDSENDAITMINGDVVSIPFGYPVAWDPSSPSSDKSAALPANSSDKLAGIVIHSHDYEREFTLPDGTTAGELDSVGLVPGTVMPVLTHGVIWVKVSTAVVAGAGSVYVAYAAGSVYTAAGQMGATSDSSVITVTNARWISSAASGGFAKLRIGANFA
jgi:hypothetical protein